MPSLGPGTDDLGALLGPSGFVPQCQGAGLRGVTWPYCAHIPRAARQALCFSLGLWSSIFFTVLRGNQKPFSWRHREEGRELLPSRAGPGAFLWSLRDPLLHRTRPISLGLRPGRGQVQPPQARCLDVDVLAEEGWSLWGGKAEPNARGSHPCPHLPLSCLRTFPWGWKAGLAPGHSLGTPLLSCHPAGGTDSPAQVLLPGQGRKMLQWEKASRAWRYLPDDLLRGRCLQPGELCIPPPLLLVVSVRLQVC